MLLTISLMCSFLITSCLVLLMALLRHLISQVMIFLSRFLFRVHIWHWYVRVGMKMELMSLALVSMGMLGVSGVVQDGS